MLETIKWIKNAVSTKGLTESTSYYKVANGQILATDGKITAGHPWPTDDLYLVPGIEFDKIVSRYSGKVTIEVGSNEITIKSGKSRGTVQTLNPGDWDFPLISDETWEPIPRNLLNVIRQLKPFISENATHAWSLGVTLQDGWCFATNNVALAGVQLTELHDIDVVLPLWAIEFLMNREQKLTHWTWTDNYVAFKWENGAWMKSQLIDSKFPPQASQLIKQATMENNDVEISDEFREAFERVAFENDGTVVYGENSLTSAFGRAQIVEEIETPELEGMNTIWSVKHLRPVIACAEWWSPTNYPRPAFFQGDGIVGCIIGRTQ